jgi:hypothetical protein
MQDNSPFFVEPARLPLGKMTINYFTIQSCCIKDLLLMLTASPIKVSIFIKQLFIITVPSSIFANVILIVGLILHGRENPFF